MNKQKCSLNRSHSDNDCMNITNGNIETSNFPQVNMEEVCMYVLLWTIGWIQK